MRVPVERAVPLLVSAPPERVVALLTVRVPLEKVRVPLETVRLLKV